MKVDKNICCATCIADAAFLIGATPHRHPSSTYVPGRDVLVQTLLSKGGLLQNLRNESRQKFVCCLVFINFGIFHLKVVLGLLFRP